MNRLNNHSSKGLTLPEAVVATVVIAIGFLGALSAFRGIATAIFVSQTKQTAVSLAREKLEALQVNPYYRLRTWTAPANFTRNGTTLFQYDPLNDVEEIEVSRVKYQRTYTVEKVYRDPVSGDLKPLPLGTYSAYYSDAGLKRIWTHVAWVGRGGEWTKVTVVGLKENPVRTRGEVEFRGVVTDTNAVPLDGMVVMPIELAGAVSAVSQVGTGQYSFMVRPGTYTLRAQDGKYNPYEYYSQRKTVYVDYNTSPVTVNFQLQRVIGGTVNAVWWFNPNPLISRVCGGYLDPASSVEQEWVEIFNPTTWTWDVTKLRLQYYLQHSSTSLDGTVDPLHTIDVDYHQTSVGPGRYFLFANTDQLKINGTTINADAVWSVDPAKNQVYRVRGRFSPETNHPDLITTALPGVPLPHQSPGSVLNGGGGSLRLSTWTYITLDGVAWTGGGNSPVDPPQNPYVRDPGWNVYLTDKRTTDPSHRLGDWGYNPNLPEGTGLDVKDEWIRYSSTHGWEENADVGPAYVSNVDARDWGQWEPGLPGPLGRFEPRNSQHPAVPVVAGRYSCTVDSPFPLNGQSRSWVNDGVSRPTSVQTTLVYDPAYTANIYHDTSKPQDVTRPVYGLHTIPRVTTGTWVWGLWSKRNIGYEYMASSQVVINVGPGDGFTRQAVLTSQSTTTWAFGQVRDAFQVPQEDIYVELFTGGVLRDTMLTRMGGAFNVEGPAVGSGEVRVNAIGTVGYVQRFGQGGWTGGFTGGWGDINAGNAGYVDLIYTGFLHGHVEDGDTHTPIPDVVVSVINAASQEERANGLTDANGNFRVYVSTGDYKVRVIPELEEVVTPELSGIISITQATANTAYSVDAGTYTITAAFGKRSGLMVDANGDPVKTGVLVVLTTSTVLASAPPPVITAAFRGGNTRFYMTSSNALGRYTFDVAKGTYNVYAYYPVFGANGVTPTWTRKDLTGQLINSGNNPTDFPTLTW